MQATREDDMGYIVVGMDGAAACEVENEDDAERIAIEMANERQEVCAYFDGDDEVVIEPTTTWVVVDDVTPNRATCISVHGSRDEALDAAGGGDIVLELRSERVPAPGERIYVYGQRRLCYAR